MTEAEQIKLLEQKNQALSNQLDKITNEKFKAQEIATDLKNRLETKLYSEKLAAWGIDRALETGRRDSANINTAEDVISAADKFCKWIKQADPALEIPPVETTH